MASEPPLTSPNSSTGEMVSARVPDGVRIYAVGDIHGRADLLVRMLHLIEADGNAAMAVRETMLVFIGDYVDRGPDSAGVIDKLLSLKRDSRYTCHLLKGNHEVMFMDFLEDPAAFLHWAVNGGVETLESYGVDVAAIAEGEGGADALGQAAIAAIPDAHLALLANLETWVTVGDYLFVHAGIRPGVPLEAQVDQDLIWIREPFLDYEGDFGKVVVHGHTPVRAPEVRANRIDIDTLAWRSDTLTALVVEGNSRRFLQT